MTSEGKAAAERALAQLTPVRRNEGRRLIVGQFGSLVEVMGDEKADAYLDAHSLTRRTRVRAARRLGQIILDA
jgi:hypothetical protein